MKIRILKVKIIRENGEKETIDSWEIMDKSEIEDYRSLLLKKEYVIKVLFTYEEIE